MAKCKICKEMIKTHSSRRNPIEKDTAYVIIRRFVNVNWTASHYHYKCFVEALLEDCPNFNECTEQAIENHVPIHNEGYD